jgi:hypothetical protein
MATKTVIFAWICEECKKVKQIEIPVGDDYHGPTVYLEKGLACVLHDKLFSWWDRAKEIKAGWCD